MRSTASGRLPGGGHLEREFRPRDLRRHAVRAADAAVRGAVQVLSGFALATPSSISQAIRPQLEAHHFARRALPRLHVKRRARADLSSTDRCPSIRLLRRRCGRPSIWCRDPIGYGARSTIHLPVSFNTSSPSEALPMLISMFAQTQHDNTRVCVLLAASLQIPTLLLPF